MYLPSGEYLGLPSYAGFDAVMFRYGFFRSSSEIMNRSLLVEEAGAFLVFRNVNKLFAVGREVILEGSAELKPGRIIVTGCDVSCFPSLNVGQKGVGP